MHNAEPNKDDQEELKEIFKPDPVPITQPVVPISIPQPVLSIHQLVLPVPNLEDDS
jgi:hypothetical protein